MIPLRSPTSGQPLKHDTPHSLVDGWGGRWPVVDGIPFLRVEQEGLVTVALDALDRGHSDEALVALLTNQDDWWTGPATDLGELRRLVRERDTLSLREAMALLRLGPVADYFAYRWSDPTYLAGLALLEAHWNAPATAFELACGIGHYLRELTRRGVACLGADVVFAKCWLAKHWVAPDAEYVVFDAGATWPLGDARFDLVQCHDALYFLPKQQQVVSRLRETTSENGLLALSRIRNAGCWKWTGKPALALDEVRSLFPSATVYREEKLISALAAGTAPEPLDEIDAEELEYTSAFCLAESPVLSPRPLEAGLAMPLPSAKLRRNPLLTDGGVAWPSPEYRSEYEIGALWALVGGKRDLDFDPIRFRVQVDLPERW